METYIVTLSHPFVESRTVLLKGHNPDEVKKVATKVFEGWTVVDCASATTAPTNPPTGGVNTMPVDDTVIRTDGTF